jgi:inner membrane protein
MHIPTHILAGWCVANSIPRLTAKDRLVLVLASSLPDLDGLGLIRSQEAYFAVHHVWGHNLLVGTLGCLLFSYWADHRRRSFLFAVIVFHLHLLMDFFGSGLGWGIAYFWPFSDHYFLTENAWSLGGWQNYVTLGILVIWSVSILRSKRRTPVEILAPAVDRAFVNVFCAPLLPTASQQPEK